MIKKIKRGGISQIAYCSNILLLTMHILYLINYLKVPICAKPDFPGLSGHEVALGGRRV